MGAEQGPAATLRNAVTKARDKVAFGTNYDKNNQGMFGKFFGSKIEDSPDTAAARAELSSAVGQLVAADPGATPNVIDAVTTLYSDPSLAGVPVTELELTEEDGTPIVLTPQEIQAVTRIMTGLNGISQGNQ